jgi:hypothetical protein
VDAAGGGFALRIAEITYSGWLAAFGLTLLVEIPAVLWLARRLEPRPYRRATLALLGNALSHPAVWFAFPTLHLGWVQTTILSETWAWLVEGALYHVGFAHAGWRPALVVSFVANLLSFGLGLGLWALGALG